MNDGPPKNVSPISQPLLWSSRLLCAEDLRKNLNGQRELILTPRTIITPLAADELRSRGVKILWQENAQEKQPCRGPWGYTQEKNDVTVQAAIRALEREGIQWISLPAKEMQPWRWALALATCIRDGKCQGGVVFCSDPSLICCVANKVRGLRAAVVTSLAQAARARTSLAANLVAIEMPGPTFFEIRQILRTLCLGDFPACSSALADILKEAEHAHR